MSNAEEHGYEMCESCEERAEVYCEECNEHLCNECAEKVHGHKKKRGHTVVAIGVGARAHAPYVTPPTAKRRKEGRGGTVESSHSPRELELEDEMDTASDSDQESAVSIGDAAGALMMKDEQALIKLLVAEFRGLPAGFRVKCKHDAELQIACLVRKFKRMHSGSGWKKGTEDQREEIIAGGVTQNRKTYIKAVGVWVGFRLGVSAVIMSTGKNGTHSLWCKLSKIFTEFPDESRPDLAFSGDSPYSNKEHRKLLRQCVEKAGCILVNDTAVQVDHVQQVIMMSIGHASCRDIPRSRAPQVQLYMDEADAFYRNAEMPIKLESAVQKFLDTVQPLVRTFVSATLIPVFLHLKGKAQSVDGNSIIYTQPDEGYCGVRDFHPLADKDGRAIFLKPGDFTKGNGYSNWKLDRFYENALAGPAAALVLNITNPGVHTTNNVYDHATKIQEKYHKVGCIVFVAQEKIYFAPKNLGRPPFTFEKSKTIGEAIQYADDSDGLLYPLVVIGYSQMIRGDSFRSDRRVPTHICCALGSQMSIEKIVQALGRASGLSKDVLVQNGFGYVTVLTFANDYETARAYSVWLKEMRDKINGGTTIQDALSAAATYSDDANITALQTRSIGQRKDKLYLETAFKSPNAGQERTGIKWIGEEIGKEPLKRLLLQVAEENFSEDADTFRKEVAEKGDGDQLPGGTADEYLHALRVRPGVNEGLVAVHTAKTVRHELHSLCRLGILKKCSQFVRLQKRPEQFFVPDSKTL